MPIAMPSSIDPLVPVLRDNFWLTIHVLTITLGYAAFALAMGFGHILLLVLCAQPGAARADQPMHFWLYRVLQLGVMLLAAGTILGGVWANYSWGRFWGWDPKETWALIALLCYILTLHGRLAGWWTQFGLVVASVVCFLAVLMAWYGVNFVLGKGLHSYGFGLGGETYVVSFVVADLLFVAFAFWRYRGNKAAGTTEFARGRDLRERRGIDVERLVAPGKTVYDPAERECCRDDPALPFLSESRDSFRQCVSAVVAARTMVPSPRPRKRSSIRRWNRCAAPA